MTHNISRWCWPSRDPYAIAPIFDSPDSTQSNEEPSGSIVMDDRLDKIFFAKQVINNACATQAILSILLNVDHEEVKLGSTLEDFKSFSSTFDPQLKGELGEALVWFI